MNRSLVRIRTVNYLTNIKVVKSLEVINTRKLGTYYIVAYKIGNLITSTTKFIFLYYPIHRLKICIFI